MRPPLFGARRDRILRQARAWGGARLEEALGMLADTELALRSSTRAPTQASLERTLLRLAMLTRR
jgi:DNA polymerase-3 subunit delta